MGIAGCRGHDTLEHPAEQPARENGDKTAWIIGHLHIHRCTTANATSKETDPLTDLRVLAHYLIDQMIPPDASVYFERHQCRRI